MNTTNDIEQLVTRAREAQRQYKRTCSSANAQIHTADKERSDALREAYKHGVSQRQLALVAGISWARVHQLIHYPPLEDDNAGEQDTTRRADS